MIHFRTVEFFFRTKLSFQNLHETCIQPQKLYKLPGSTNIVNERIVCNQAYQWFHKTMNK